MPDRFAEEAVTEGAFTDDSSSSSMIRLFPAYSLLLILVMALLPVLRRIRPCDPDERKP